MIIDKPNAVSAVAYAKHHLKRCLDNQVACATCHLLSKCNMMVTTLRLFADANLSNDLIKQNEEI